MRTAKDLELLLLVKEKKIQDLNLEIERLKEEYMILQNASDEVEEELQQRINETIEYIEKIQKQWNDKSVPEQNIYLFETYLKGVSKIVVIKDILRGKDNE